MSNQIEVRRLKNFGGREAHAKRLFLKIWAECGHRVLALPEETQVIVLDDFLTALKSRLMVHERIAGILGGCHE